MSTPGEIANMAAWAKARAERGYSIPPHIREALQRAQPISPSALPQPLAPRNPILTRPATSRGQTAPRDTTNLARPKTSRGPTTPPTAPVRPLFPLRSLTAQTAIPLRPSTANPRPAPESFGYGVNSDSPFHFQTVHKTMKIEEAQVNPEIARRGLLYGAEFQPGYVPPPSPAAVEKKSFTQKMKDKADVAKDKAAILAMEATYAVKKEAKFWVDSW